jgi:phage tail sheath protein FI
MAFVSAGAYAREVDLSLYAETLTNTIFAMAHTFNKGPIGEATLVNNESRLIELFGEPIDPQVSASAAQGWFAARQYLKRGNQLQVTRVESAATPAAYAAMSVHGVSDDSMTSTNDGVTGVANTRTFTSAGSTFDTDGVKVGCVLQVSGLAAGGASADDGFYVITDVTATVLRVDRDWPTGGLSTLVFTVWAAKKEGGVDGVTSAVALRTFTSAGATFQTNGVVAGDVLYVNDSGTLTDNGYYTIASVDSETQVTIDRDWPDGSNTSLDYEIYGSNSHSATQLEAQSDGASSVPATRTLTSALASFVSNGVRAGDVVAVEGTAGDEGWYTIASVDSETVLTISEDWPTGSLGTLVYEVWTLNRSGNTSTDGEFVDAGADFEEQGVKAGDILYINDAVSTGDNGYYLISGLKTGSTDTTLEVNVAAWPIGSLTDLSYTIISGSVTFTAITKGTWATGMQLITTRNPGDKDLFDLATRDSAGVLQLEKVFAMDRSTVVADTLANSGLWTATLVTGRGEIVPGKTTIVAGGDDGYTGIVDGDYIGSVVTGTGLKSFRNAEALDINLVAVPGSTSQNVQDELINLAESRADCFAILDIPDDPTVDSVQDALDFSNGLLGRSTALNSNYAGVYWSWQKVYDEFHDVDVWTAPSGHVAAVFAHNDNQQGSWFAPAGMKRGKVIGSTEARFSPDQDERDSLQSSGQVVNPIVNFTGEGIFVYGQKTTTRITSALDRVNVRRMMLYVEKIIATAARQLVFDPNDEVLEREFSQLAEPVLRDVLSKRGIREWRIIAATTDNDRDNNKAVFQIFIKPTKAAPLKEQTFRRLLRNFKN